MTSVVVINCLRKYGMGTSHESQNDSGNHLDPYITVDGFRVLSLKSCRALVQGTATCFVSGLGIQGHA